MGCAEPFLARMLEEAGFVKRKCGGEDSGKLEYVLPVPSFQIQGAV